MNAERLRFAATTPSGELWRFAGNTLNALATSADLPTRQAVADQFSAPQEDYGSLVAVLEPPKGEA